MSPALVLLTSAVVAAFFLVVVRAMLRSRRLAVQTGIPALVGQVGIATSELAPRGTVKVDSEAWTAESAGGTIRAGERVKIIGAAGVTLQVTRQERGTEPWNRSFPTSS